MPANIAVSQGRHLAFYADKPAWHNLGTVAAGAQTPEDAIALAGTGYVVDKAPVYALIDGQMVEATDHRATYRTDTGQVLGMVSPDYVPIQNITPMQMLGEIVRTKEAGIVAHAALGRGERLFAVLDVASRSDLTIKRDPSRHLAFLVAQWWHDGTGALSFGPYSVRVECQNMANAQLEWAKRQGLLVRIQHIGNVGSAVDEARRILGYAEQSIDVWHRVMNELAEAPLPAPEARWMSDFLVQLIPDPEGDVDSRGGRALRNRVEAREAISHLFDRSPTLVGVPNSPYRVFQAVTEYADHYRPIRIADPDKVPAARFRSLTEGPSAELKARAAELLRQEFEVGVPVR